MTREQVRLFFGVVNTCNQNVFEVDALLLTVRVVFAGVEQTRQVIFAIHRHNFVSHQVSRAVERDRKAALQGFVGQLPDLRRQSAGRDGNVARANLEAPGRVDDPDGADHVGEVGQRFAHTHEDDVIDLFTARFFHRQQLLHDFAGIEIARESIEAAGAKFAAVGAADLRRHTNSTPIRSLAVQSRGGWNKHRLDQISVP